MGAKKQQEEADMSLVGHLKELRNRVALIVVALIVLFMVCFAVVKQLADGLLSMGRDIGFLFVYIAPSELLTSYFKLAFVAALVICAPLALSQIWGFMAPALEPREKKAILPALFGGLMFFALGSVFCYLVALPFMLQFLLAFNTADYITSSISVANYLDFVIAMLLTFGLVFEEPMLVLVLSRLGIVKPALLRKGRRFSIPLTFVVAALITPPDVVSQFMVAMPMMVLYELGILISLAIEKSKAKKEKEEDENSEDGEDAEDDDKEA